MIYLHEDPEQAWAELGDHILWEAVTYGRWSQASRSLMHLPGVQTLEEVPRPGPARAGLTVVAVPRAGGRCSIRGPRLKSGFLTEF
jgi:hypothetical protein